MILQKLKSGRVVALIEDDSHICEWIKQSGRLDHDQNCLPLLEPYIHKGQTVIDVGSFVADHTEFYRQRVGRTGKVYAFEPNPKAFECLKYNMADYPNVACFNVGISDKSETIGLVEDKNAGATYPTKGTQIPCITIDSLNLSECHFIKIDCEGYELKVLTGAKQTIEKYKPKMLIEINRGALVRQGITAFEVFAYLSSIGYEYRNIYAGQGLDDEQLDILCIPKIV
jgi:FkbM family methyltransferase